MSRCKRYWLLPNNLNVFKAPRGRSLLLMVCLYGQFRCRKGIGPSAEKVLDQAPPTPAALPTAAAPNDRAALAERHPYTIDSNGEGLSFRSVDCCRNSRTNVLTNRCIERRSGGSRGFVHSVGLGRGGGSRMSTAC